ncbi:hypothetical protein [Kitasatospora sp. NPDC088346]|uniref:hypothetical protein n=1 Tax=Kitasatospora sp. NPDC088346 TaxID=3364073 RepID=UPI00380B1A60
MSPEDDFSHALRAAAQSAPPAPLELMAAGAAQRGRRRRRRHAVIASAAAVAALGCLGAFTLQLRPASEDAGRTPATAPAAASPSPSASAQAPADAGRLLELFASKLPADLRLSRPVKHDPGPAGSPAAGLMTAGYTATDGRGTGGVEISISRGVPHGRTAGDGGCGPDTADCTTAAQPDGSYLTVHRPERALGGEQVWRAVLRRPDGTVVSVSAGNVPGPGSGRSEPYPNAPLLSPDQLSALALDPAWPPMAAGLPAP